MIYTQISSTDLADLALAIRYEADGAVMMKGLRSDLRAAAKPAETAAKASIMAMPSTGLRNVGGSLRSAVRKEIKTQTKLSARSASVKIKVKRQSVRGFNNPAKRLNDTKPWRHPVRPWKREGNQVVALPRNEWTWVTQRSPRPGWFDDPMRANRPAYEAAVRKAMNDTAERIARNT